MNYCGTVMKGHAFSLLWIKVDRELKDVHFKYFGRFIKTWLLYKGNQDENSYGQRRIQQKIISKYHY